MHTCMHLDNMLLNMNVIHGNQRWHCMSFLKELATSAVVQQHAAATMGDNGIKQNMVLITV